MPKDAEKRKKFDLEKQKKKCAEFIKDKLAPGKDDVRTWTNLLKRRINHWSGKKLIESPNRIGSIYYCLHCIL